MLSRAFSKLAELRGKVGVYDYGRSGALVYTSFFWLGP